MLRFALAALLASVLATRTHAASDKVEVNLFAEAGCPYCAHFTVASIAPMFENGLSDLMNFRYIAWGNAKNFTGPVRASDNVLHRLALAGHSSRLVPKE